MRLDFRIGLIVGLGATLAIGLYCIWLWQQERQIVRHTENLFHKIEQKNWSGVADFIAADYADQWGNDRARVLERMRLVLGYSRHLRINVSEANCRIDNTGVGFWRGRIAIESDDAELVAIVKERVNSLTTPFELQWRHLSRKPWDWKLVRVSNPELEIPAGFD
jgi:hypothetical protein